MSRVLKYAICLGGGVLLQGCLAKTVVDVATAPMKVASSAVDIATTSQSEADENRGRELRKREEKLGKLEREYAKQDERCKDGDADACDRREELRVEIWDIMPTVPARTP